MKLNFDEPTTEALTIRITFNDVEVLRQDFAKGTTPSVEYNPPAKTSGVAQAYFIHGDKEMPAGSATYWAPDFLGAQMLVKEAGKLAESRKPWQARTQLKAAAKLFEKFAPDSEDAANAYLSLSFICFDAKARKHMEAVRQSEALAWYEKAISVWERNGNFAQLGGNLTNLSVMYARFGDRITGLERAERGLAIARIQERKDPEAIHAWTQTAWHMLGLNMIDEADKVIEDGLKRFDGNPLCAYLWHQKSQVYAAHSAQCKEIAQRMLPPDMCALD